MWTIIDLRKSVQRQEKKVEHFTDNKPYVYTKSLVGHTIQVTCHGIPATFAVGANSALNEMHIAETVPLAVKIAVGTKPVSPIDFLNAVEAAIPTTPAAGTAHADPSTSAHPHASSEHGILRHFMVVDEGIRLNSYLKDAEAVALSQDLFNFKALRVHNPVNEDSYTQYDHSFSTDGEQVAVRFRSDLNAAEVIDVKLEENRKLHHL